MSLADLEKPVPVAFDYATFRYYLELDILQDTAKFLDWVDSNTPYRNAQPIYDAMTDEVLLRMGYTHPLQVPEDEIKKMMYLGRIEAWRKVVHNTVTDIDMQYDIDGNETFETIMRSEFHKEAVRQWQIAQQAFNDEFPIASQEPVQISTPAVRTYAGAIRARW